MQLLKNENDCALFLNADELHFVRTKPKKSTLGFVLALLGVIFFINGIVQLIMGHQGLAALLLPLGLISLFFWARLRQKNRKAVQEKPTVDNTLLM